MTAPVPGEHEKTSAAAAGGTCKTFVPGVYKTFSADPCET